MAQYKITRKTEAYTYEAPGHVRCMPTRQHDPNEVDGGKMIMGITYFLPGGGCEYGANPLESIYYILEGVGHVVEDGEEYDLAAGDMMQCRDGSSHSIENRSDKPLRFLALIINVRDPA